MSRLFEQLPLGTAKLGHRLAMAPLTRFRSEDDSSPSEMNVKHYEQRACVPGTLLISEATAISPGANGSPNVPGIWTESHIKAWGKVTAAVHAKGSLIYCQLWHQGRQADPKGLRERGQRLVSSSAVPMGPESETPEALTEEEIAQIIADYATAAKNAVAAGFDGVEVHGANGYLLDQFLQTTCNRREDRWGGSVENRARFHLEVTRAVVEAVGADRTGIRLSPYSTFGGMGMDEPEPTFTYLAQQLKTLKLAYLHVIEARIKGNTESDCGGDRNVRWLVELWDNASPVLLAGGFTAESARKAADEEYKGYDVVIVFGRYFTANPDLVFRLKENVPLTPYDRSLFYIPKSPKGYTDYPFSEQFLAATA